jgi:hypothetical protein
VRAAVRCALIHRASVPIIAVGIGGAGCERYADRGTTQRTALTRCLTFGILERLTAKWTRRFDLHPGEVGTGGVSTLTAGVSVVQHWCRRHQLHRFTLATIQRIELAHTELTWSLGTDGAWCTRRANGAVPPTRDTTTLWRGRRRWQRYPAAVQSAGHRLEDLIDSDFLIAVGISKWTHRHRHVPQGDVHQREQLGHGDFRIPVTITDTGAHQSLMRWIDEA